MDNFLEAKVLEVRVFQCSICDEQFSSPEEVLIHQDTEKKFQKTFGDVRKGDSLKVSYGGDDFANLLVVDSTDFSEHRKCGERFVVISINQDTKKRCVVNAEKKNIKRATQGEIDTYKANKAD